MTLSGNNQTQRLIATLWQRNRPNILDRLALLDQAAKAASAQALTPSLRAEAMAVAHKLAGSLGMFGFHDGTRMARELEVHFQCHTPDTDCLLALTIQLRQTLFAVRNSGVHRVAQN
jgi:HPt (histidine-containing phosphotransfer) domain-containing protein